MKLPRAPFSILLPLLDIAIWVALVAVPVTLLYFNLENAASPRPGDVAVGNVMTVSREHLFSIALYGATFRYSHLITAINLPGTIVELLVSLPTSWPASWHPPALLLDTWRYLVFPFFCLPAWWLVGWGLDALSGRCRLHWSLLLIGSLLCASMAFFFLGLRFGLSESEKGTVVPWALSGLGLWALLFGVLPAAWIRQARTRLPVSGGSGSLQGRAEQR